MSNPCKYCRFRNDDGWLWLENEVSEMLMPDSKGNWLLKSIPCIVIVVCLIMAFLI